MSRFFAFDKIDAVASIKGMDVKLVEKIGEIYEINAPSAITKLERGLINQTFLVETDSDKYILQRMHEIYSPEITENVDVATSHLERNGMETPRIIPAKNGDLTFRHNGADWRMMTYIDGVSLDTTSDSKTIESAGVLVGKFHRTLNNADYTLHPDGLKWHDIDFSMETLRKTAEEFKGTEKGSSLEKLTSMILSTHEGLKSFPVTLEIVVHGDLKLDNIRFDNAEKQALCLLDLDGVGKHPLIFDLGDAVRSWCNPLGEDAPNPSFETPLFESMMRGYIEGTKGAYDDELRRIPQAAVAIALELAARFLHDAYTESYFRLEPRKYKTLFEQNSKKGGGQFILAKDILNKQKQMEDIIQSLLK